MGGPPALLQRTERRMSAISQNHTRLLGELVASEGSRVVLIFSPLLMVVLGRLCGDAITRTAGMSISYSGCVKASVLAGLDGPMGRPLLGNRFHQPVAAMMAS